MPILESYRKDNGETRVKPILGSHTVRVHANLQKQILLAYQF